MFLVRGGPLGGVECWINGNHVNHRNDENHANPECKPRVRQTTGLENTRFIKIGGKKLMSVIFPPAILGPDMAAQIFADAWEFGVLSAGKPHNYEVPSGLFGEVAHLLFLAFSFSHFCSPFTF